MFKEKGMVLVYGYVSCDNKIFIRHCWCVKDNRIIDTTLFNRRNIEKEAPKYVYIECFKINNCEELHQMMLNTDGPAALNYKDVEEANVVEKIVKTYPEAIVIIGDNNIFVGDKNIVQA